MKRRNRYSSRLAGAAAVGPALARINGDGNFDIVIANDGFGTGPQSSQVRLDGGLGGFSCSGVSADTRDSNGVALGYVK